MARLSKAEIEKTARGLAAAGVQVGEVRLCPNGEVRFFARSESATGCDDDAVSEITRKLGRV